MTNADSDYSRRAHALRFQQQADIRDLPTDDIEAHRPGPFIGKAGSTRSDECRVSTPLRTPKRAGTVPSRTSWSSPAMIIYPFKGVDSITFGMSVAAALPLVAGGAYERMNRGGDDFETEHVIYDTNDHGAKVHRLWLHELKDYQGIQAISIFIGPLFLEGQQNDLLNVSRAEIKALLPGKVLQLDSQTDQFDDLGLSVYFEEPGLAHKPAVILVVSAPYLALLNSL